MTAGDRGVVGFDVVVPSVGRSSLRALLDDLAAQEGPQPGRVVVVDDRRAPTGDLGLPAALPGGAPVVVRRGGGRGPAAARNTGWRAARSLWVAFLDDDVRLPQGWAEALGRDLAGAGARTGGVQGRIVVPRPDGRRPTDRERGTIALEDAVWATADMAYRREALAAVGGFDERFPRAYREDADLALRVRRAGWDLTRGNRHVVHPVRPASPAEDVLFSLRAQRGNADDALMRALHGPRWRELAETGAGRRRAHLATTAAGATGLGAWAASTAAPPALRPALRAAAAVATTAWTASTASFARARIAPGPRTPREVGAMVVTSALVPPAAVLHRARGAWRWRRGAAAWPPVEAVLLDRDGTLVHDVPYNGDPALVRPVEGAREALDALRRRGIRLGVVTNQSGVARGLIDRHQVDAVNARVEAELGPFDTWQVCPHGDGDGCGCRKPAPGLVADAAAALGVAVERCVVIGDTAGDVGAALAAGARAVLVPNPVTRPEEVLEAPHVAPDLRAAVRLVLRGAV